MKTERTVVDRTSWSGRRIEIAVVGISGRAWIRARVDGKQAATREGIGNLKEPKIVGGVEYTHCATVDHGSVALTRAEAEAIERAQSDMQASLRGTQEGLKNERRALWCAWLDAQRDWLDAREAWFEDGARGDGPSDAAICLSKAAFEAFDRAHPELRDELEREAKARAEKHAWD